ncbi:hypothetical protein IQ241_07635 [Romeria aff. gracilis LEGE 07310]|uniref:Uncharacterized protein n=1 Tax=Vasconcelosia minhoensis LEGE 07310 TaxID=915328 RepID=A0A8J7DB35_9CYAN|nr:hypothetical protein [Romeria gracilis]MBE9077167.1 hypothetical protein [Romeria aff. gracilis LEGE 07310]
MTEEVKVQEFVLVLATKGQSPSILNADFLKYSGIVSEDMELAREPIYTNQLIQIGYKNGLVITAQPNRIVFSELLQGKSTAEITAPSIARKLVEALPKLNYQAIGINPRGYVPVEQEIATQFVSDHLLAKGPWQKYGQSSVRATVNYVYNLDRGQLNLAISEASLQLPEDKTIPVVLFSGNVDHVLSAEQPEQNLQEIYQCLDSWQQDLNAYTELVNGCFLVPLSETVFKKDRTGIREPAIV